MQEKGGGKGGVVKREGDEEESEEVESDVGVIEEEVKETGQWGEAEGGRRGRGRVLVDRGELPRVVECAAKRARAPEADGFEGAGWRLEGGRGGGKKRDKVRDFTRSPGRKSCFFFFILKPMPRGSSLLSEKLLNPLDHINRRNKCNHVSNHYHALISCNPPSQP